MANVQIVIKLDEDTYKDIITHNRENREGAKSAYYFEGLIQNCTLLPEGHGRLGDLDVLRKEVSSWGMNDYEPSDFIDVIDQADTIIEADKAESEG